MADNNGETRSYSEDELQVASVLADMSYLAPLNSTRRKRKLVEFNPIHNHLTLYYDTNLIPTWCLKKRRSAFTAPSSPLRRRDNNVISLHPPPPPPLLAVKAEPEEDRRSPSTPLSLPLSPWESAADCVPRLPPCPFNAHKKLTSEKLRDTYDEKLKINQVYKEDIEKVKVHLQTLQARNCRLKQLKEELYGMREDEEGEVRVERERGDEEREGSTRQETTSARVAVNDYVHAAPSTSAQVFGHLGPCEQAHQHSGPRLGPVHRPAGGKVIDLNLASEVVEQEHEQPMMSDHSVRQMEMNNVAEQDQTVSDPAGQEQLLMRNTREQLPVKRVAEQERTMGVHTAGQEQLRSEVTAVEKQALMHHTQEQEQGQQQEQEQGQQQLRMSQIAEQQKLKPLMWYSAVEHQTQLSAKLNRKLRLDKQRQKQQRRLFSAK